jgi:hypothetical protein
LSSKGKKVLAIGSGILLLAVVAFLLLANRADIPIVRELAEPRKCPLTGQEPRREALLDRPAVAVKVVNAAAAYPLSGLENADVVFEELVEGGITRFMAIYHCGDADRAGPVRSARAIDPAIMTPTTRILAFSGANAPVRQALADADVVVVDEDTPGGALQRVPREGISFEHTLYADTRTARRVGAERYDESPGNGYEFGALGDLDARGRPATTVTITFSPASVITYEWNGDRWLRSQAGEPFVTEAGDQIAVENVLVEEHEVVFSDIVDVAGGRSVEIADVTGSGRAFLFRNGRAIPGRWERDSVEGAVRFVTRQGGEMVFEPGSIWIHLAPTETGEIQGSVSFEGDDAE